MRRSLIPFSERPWKSKFKYPAILLETFLYGVHLVMFGSCAYLLIRRNVTRRKLLAALSVLFLLATADIIITLFFVFHFAIPKDLSRAAIALQERGHPKTLGDPLKIKFGFYVVANAIASGLLVHRCYEFWQNRRIVIAPIALILVGTVLSFVLISTRHLRDKLSAASFIISAAANFSMTLLIASRVYWTSRKARAIPLDLARIKEVVAILLIDSGAIYSLSVFLYLVFHTLVISASLTQIAGVSVTAMTLRNAASNEPLGENTIANVDNASQLQSDALPGVPVSTCSTAQDAIRSSITSKNGCEGVIAVTSPGRQG